MFNYIMKVLEKEVWNVNCFLMFSACFLYGGLGAMGCGLNFSESD
jgi:hypothetical protein